MYIIYTIFEMNSLEEQKLVEDLGNTQINLVFLSARTIF